MKRLALFALVAVVGLVASGCGGSGGDGGSTPTPAPDKPWLLSFGEQKLATGPDGQPVLTDIVCAEDGGDPCGALNARFAATGREVRITVETKPTFNMLRSQEDGSGSE